MSDYLYARIYTRETPTMPWSPAHNGPVDRIKELTRNYVESFGQPDRTNLTESIEADVLLLWWNSGVQVRVCFDKKQNYELIHCPTCCRQMMPPSYDKKVVECSHGWRVSWDLDTGANTWRCKEVTRD
jgi:hypothetical protein